MLITFRGFVTVAAFSVAVGFATAQEVDEVPKNSKIEYVDHGKIEAIREAEYRIGGIDRILLIEDDWELNRCVELLPKLPKIDANKKCLLVVMSWPHMARSLRAIEIEKETMVVKIDEAKPPLTRTKEYLRPSFLVFEMPSWKGPVRVEINGEARFTILRDGELLTRTDEIWEEILRLHSGGRPTLPQQVRRYKGMWRDMPEEEIKHKLMSDKEKFLREDVAPYYDLLFRDLVDLRAKSAIPRIFALIESMGKHDKAERPAGNALVGIGGPELIAQCKVGINSSNPRARAVAFGLLGQYATPDMRDMARDKIAELNQTTALNSLQILRRIGITKDDVPFLMHALDQVAKYYAKELEAKPFPEGYSGEVGLALTYELGQLGPDAAEALPVLERFTTDGRLPLIAFQKNAQDAIDKIKNTTPKESR